MKIRITGFIICGLMPLLWLTNEADGLSLPDRMQRIINHRRNAFSQVRSENISHNTFQIIKNDFLLNDDITGGVKQETPSIAINNDGNAIITWTDFRDGNADIYIQRLDPNCNFIDANYRANTDAGMMWQGDPSVAVSNQGNFIVAWEDRRLYNSDVYVQRFNSQGQPVDTNFRANDNLGNSDQRNTAVIILPNQNFIVVWDDWRNDWGDIFAQVYDSSGSRINNNIRINDDISGNTQYAPSIAQDSIGNYIIAWMDGRNGNWDIFAQRFNYQGQRLGNNFCVNDANSSFQGYPEITCARDGQFTIVWEDQRNGNTDVYAQRFDAQANRLGLNFKVNDDNTTLSQNSPDIIYDNSGNFVVTWTDERLGNADIFAQRYNSLGNTVGSNFRINDDASGQNQNTPAIAISNIGNFWIVWSDTRFANNNIFFQVCHNDGTLIGINRQVNDDIASSHQRCSYIAQDNARNYVVVWEDERNGNTDIYGVRLDSLGNIMGSNFRVNDDSYNATHYYASVASNFSGDFIVAWSDGRNNDFDIYAQRYSSNGTPIGNNFRVSNDTAHAAQWYPIVSCDSIGNAIIVWIDYRNNNEDIYGQLFDCLNNPVGSNFQINNKTDGSQLYGYVARNRKGNFIVTWMDNRNGNFDIYAQRYDSIGTPLGTNFIVNDDLASSFQGYPAVTIDQSSNIFITWEDDRNSVTDIYLQRYDANGIPFGVNCRVDDDENNTDQYSPTIACDEDGKLIVVWCDFRNNDDDPEIYAQAYLPCGSELGDNRQINERDFFNYNNQWLVAQGVVTSNSKICFAWIDNRRHKGWDIYAKLVDWDYLAGIKQEPSVTNYTFSQVTICPNPSFGKIFLAVRGLFTGDIEIFNSVGNKVQTISASRLTNNNQMIELSQMQSGIYFVKLKIDESDVIKKIVLYTGRKSVEN